VFVLLSLGFLWRLRKNCITKYEEFLRNSPGVRVETTGITYGVGHPTEAAESKPAKDVEKKP
jgi:hypothetical protein